MWSEMKITLRQDISLKTILLSAKMTVLIELMIWVRFILLSSLSSLINVRYFSMRYLINAILFYRLIGDTSDSYVEHSNGEQYLSD